MKKVLFVLVFIFIGQQAFSQVYIMTINSYSVGSCNSDEMTLDVVDPNGTRTQSCIHRDIDDGSLEELNISINAIVSQGYKLIESSYANDALLVNGGGGQLQSGSTFIFAIP